LDREPSRKPLGLRTARKAANRAVWTTNSAKGREQGRLDHERRERPRTTAKPSPTGSRPSWSKPFAAFVVQTVRALRAGGGAGGAYLPLAEQHAGLLVAEVGAAYAEAALALLVEIQGAALGEPGQSLELLLAGGL